MILLAYKHGLRASEVCNLRIDDIDLKNGSITVERLKGSLRTTQAITGHRGGPLLDELRALREWMRERRHDGSDFLFTSQKGGRLHRSQFFRVFRSVAADAGLPPAQAAPPCSEALDCDAFGISERQSGTGQNATRSQEHKPHAAVRLYDRQVSVTGDRCCADGDLLRDDPSPRQFLSLARPDDALFVDFNSLFEAVFIRGE